MNCALIAGVNRQDDTHLVELLLANGYEVHRMVHRDTLDDPDHRQRSL